LDGLSTQIAPSRFDDIEIVISDNASPDLSEAVAKKWIEENKNIKASYFRNTENVGFDRNCLAGANKANGKFVWLMSDDDSLAEGAVEKVFIAIKENADIVFAFVNYSVEASGPEDYFPCILNGNLRVTADELMVKTKFAFSFISACIFNRDILCSLDLTKYFGSHWVQLYAVKEAAIRGESLLISEPLIRMCKSTGFQDLSKERRSSQRKIDLFMEFHLSFLDYLETFRNSPYSNATYKVIRNSGWNENLGQIVSMKFSSDRYNPEEIRIVFLRMKKHFQKKILFWILHVPMLLLPKFASSFYLFLKVKYVELKAVIKTICGPL